jgi:adenosylhomocysteine nucleosidase
MENTLIVMALEDEGQGLLEKLGFEVLYCGVGKINATYHLTRRLADISKPVNKVLNLGSAGSHSFSTGTLVAADRFVQRDMDLTGLGFDLGHTPYEQYPSMISFEKYFEHLPHGVCGSGDSFLQDICPINSDIIDMEAYALAKVCMRESLPFVCVKYITDGADKSASHDWKTNLAKAAHAFVELLNAA